MKDKDVLTTNAAEKNEDTQVMQKHGMERSLGPKNQRVRFLLPLIVVRRKIKRKRTFLVHDPVTVEGWGGRMECGVVWGGE